MMSKKTQKQRQAANYRDRTSYLISSKESRRGIKYKGGKKKKGGKK